MTFIICISSNANVTGISLQYPILLNGGFSSQLTSLNNWGVKISVLHLSTLQQGVVSKWPVADKGRSWGSMEEELVAILACLPPPPSITDFLPWEQEQHRAEAALLNPRSTKLLDFNNFYLMTRRKLPCSFYRFKMPIVEIWWCWGAVYFLMVQAVEALLFWR